MLLYVGRHALQKTPARASQDLEHAGSASTIRTRNGITCDDDILNLTHCSLFTQIFKQTRQAKNADFMRLHEALAAERHGQKCSSPCS